jgi:hypothetical protein
MESDADARSVVSEESLTASPTETHRLDDISISDLSNDESEAIPSAVSAVSTDHEYEAETPRESAFRRLPPPLIEQYVRISDI